MARRRMFSLDVVDTDHFLDMPPSTQNLYFHLGMRADDEGFVSSPKRVAKAVNASDDDMKILVGKGFIIPFDSGVCVVKHWNMNNYLQSDRFKPSIYVDERNGLEEENGVYVPCIQTVSMPYTQVRLGKVSVGKDRIVGVSFARPTIQEVTDYCKERNNTVDPQKWIDHYTANGWKVGRSAMKDWKASVRTWERSEYSKPSTPSFKGTKYDPSKPSTTSELL